jgi:putative lipopolysaccharide heptosyltransferase III
MKDKKIKILVMKFRNIGDVLLTTPLIENLRRVYPDAQIDFALNKGTEAMIEGNPNIQNIHVYDRANIKEVGFFKRLWRELKFIRAIKKQKYDIAVQTTTGDRGIIVAKYAKIKTIVGFEGKNKTVNKIITHKAPKIAGLRHTVDRNLDALAALGFEPSGKRVSVYFDPDCISHLNLPLKFIHVHLTSRWMFKCANDETMAKIIDFCQHECKIPIVLTSDNNNVELKKLKDVMVLCKTSPINLGGKLTLKQTVALSKRSMLFIGVDTAIMHIAAANDIPVIALFGPSEAYEWGPWDNDLNENGYTQRNGNQTMGKHAVFQKDWDFVPCDKEGISRYGIEKTLMDFSTEMELIKQKIISNLRPVK